MIYALKLLVAVLFACGATAALCRRPFRDVLSAVAYRDAWRLVAVTTVAVYLCKFPALFLLVFAVIAIYGRAASTNQAVAPISVYLLLALIVPPISFGVGGVGDINSLLLIDRYRLLSVVVLTPAALRLLTRKRAGDGGIRALDVWIIAYVVLRIVLRIPSSSATATLRSAVEALLDTGLPYYVLTRSVRTLPDLRFVVGHLALGLVFAAGVGVLECLLQHNLYSGLQAIYDERWQLTYQLLRGGLLRVQAMTQQPILLAASMLFMAAFWIWLKGGPWRSRDFMVPFVMTMITLAGTGSRGPWLACGILFFVLLILYKLSPAAVRILLLCLFIAGVAAKMLGADEAVVSVLSVLFGQSTQDLSSIDYRRQLLDESMALIKQSPWLGVPNYAAKLQDLRQGEGIVDIVNSYVAIALAAGVVGLGVYLAPFLIIAHRCLGAIRRDESGRITPGSRFAVMIVALIVASLFMIFTSSTFGVLQLLLLVLVALPVAWLRMSEQEREADRPLPVDEERPRWVTRHAVIPSRRA